MILPEKSFGDICKKLLILNEKYYNMDRLEWEDFKLYCQAYEERTNNPITFKEMENIKNIMTFQERKQERKQYYEKYVYGWKERPCGACSGSGYYCGRACGACDGTGKEKYNSRKETKNHELL